MEIEIKNKADHIKVWNAKLSELNKPATIYEAYEERQVSSRSGKFEYIFYVDAYCKNGCEIKHTLLSNLLKKDRNVPCKCFVHIPDKKILAVWAKDEDRMDILEYCEEYDISTKPITINRRLKMRCPVCKTVFHKSLSDILLKGNCLCGKHNGRISFTQGAIHDYLEFSGLESELEYNYKGSDFDIYVKSLNLFIEYDGAHWHQDMDVDLKKSRIISDDSLATSKLIRIREKGCPQFTEKLNNVYSLDDACDEQTIIQELNELIKELYDIELSLDYKVDDRVGIIYSRIREYYNTNSIWEKDPELIAISEEADKSKFRYITINKKKNYKWKCCKCENVIEAAPITIKNNLNENKQYVCENCKLKERNFYSAVIEQDLFEFLNDEDVERAKNKFPNSSAKFQVECKKCGYIVKNSCDKISSYKGCPKCGRNKKTFKEVLSTHKNIKVVNANDDIYELPQNSKTVVEFMCVECNKHCCKPHQIRWLIRNGKFKCPKEPNKKGRTAKPGNSIVDYCPQIKQEFDYTRNGLKKPELITKSSAEKIFLKGKEKSVAVCDYYKKQKKLGLVVSKEKIVQ